MSIKPDLMDSEKVLDGDVPAYLPKPDLDYGETFEEAQSKTSFATRLGITPQSFKRRTLADAHNQLNQTLKSRHLHMIAIGGSIPFPPHASDPSLIHASRQHWGRSLRGFRRRAQPWWSGLVAH